MDFQRKSKAGFKRGRIAVETVLILAAIAILLAGAVKRMSGTDTSVVATANASADSR